MLSLNEEMTTLLRECLKVHRPDLLSVVDSSELIHVDSDLGNQLRHAVSDEFVRTGLNDDYEPNEQGFKMEQLIDLIGRMFM